jgi:NTP pyrophosphatase (non-canonical NTP hydrolase)
MVHGNVNEPRSLFVRSVNVMAEECQRISAQHGFWSEGQDRNKAEMIALMHSELSEALEAIRIDNKGGEFMMDQHLPHRRSVEVELADAVIRIMDYCAGFGWDLGGAIKEKSKFNEGRPPKHGKAF